MPNLEIIKYNQAQIQGIIVLIRLLLILALSSAAFAKDNVAQIKEYIKQSYLALYPEMSIDSISLIARNELKIYEIEILSKSLSSLKSSQGYITLTYKYKNAIMQESLRYTMRAYITTYTAIHNIPIRSNINPNNISPKRQEFTSLSSTPASKSEILQSSSKVAIPGNSIILQNKLSPKILVQKDSLVKIILYSDGIEAIAQGKALESGVKGSIIKIQNADSKRIIHAEIIDENVVMIK